MIKELTAKIKELEARITALEKQPVALYQTWYRDPEVVEEVPIIKCGSPDTAYDPPLTQMDWEDYQG